MAIEMWDALVTFVLDVELDEVHALAHEDCTFDAPTAPIPVKLNYFMRFPYTEGKVITHQDTYHLDPRSDVPVQDQEDRSMVCAEVADPE